MKHVKKFNESNNHSELINGSGLFFWNSDLDEDTKLKIVIWYKSLSAENKKYVDILRSEARDDENFSCNENEDI